MWDKTMARVLPADELGGLLAALQKSGYQLIGPKIEDEAIVLGSVETVQDLPKGWVDEQDGGHYRLKSSKKAGYFDFTHGSHTWKRYLFPPKEKLWTATKSAKGISINEHRDTPKYAFLGVRACELAAISIQDEVLMKGDYVSEAYTARREQAFIIALNCRRAGGTCFCVSQGTGPKADEGFDLALTELKDRFLVEAGSERGEQILAKLKTDDASKVDIRAADKTIQKATDGMGRKMPTKAAAILEKNLESPRWDEIVKRCLDCANCTFVCPTCFCSTTTDETSLDGATAERYRQWDSCFTLDFSYIHGGAIRKSGGERYRQWITHKLTHWHDQFGMSGCVGCGRCITWCPVGIDITAEVKAFRKEK